MIGAAVLGGTVSRIGGGKFANGATTGAFIQAFGEFVSAQDARRQNRIEVDEEFPATERKAIIAEAISQYRAQGGEGRIDNRYDLYSVTNEVSGAREEFASLADANAWLDTCDGRGSCTYVAGHTNAFTQQITIYAAAAYDMPGVTTYGFSPVVGNLTLFTVWHEDGHRILGGGCLYSESCAND